MTYDLNLRWRDERVSNRLHRTDRSHRRQTDSVIRSVRGGVRHEGDGFHTTRSLGLLRRRLRASAQRRAAVRRRRGYFPRRSFRRGHRVRERGRGGQFFD